jgi:small subunit ribosomal protein S1
VISTAQEPNDSSATDAPHQQIPSPPKAKTQTTSAEDEEDADAIELMELSLKNFKPPVEYEVGEKIIGRIVSLDHQYAFLDIGTKSEASIPLEQLKHKDGSCPEVGEKITAYVIDNTDGNLQLGTVLPGGEDKMLAIEDAYHNQVPVEGTVKALNKGGLEVHIFGKRAFCPVSQIELRYCEKPAQYIGQTLQFRIIELKEKGRNIVLSRKAILEEENKQEAKQLRQTLTEGSIHTGTVTSLQPYGAFVSLGANIEGLIHVSEISHNRVNQPDEVLKVGQQVSVQIKKYDPEKNRIALSMRSLESDPWDMAVQQFQPEMVVSGKVVRLQAFGAFVELAPGIDGLVHVSEISHRRVNHPQESLSVGDQVEAKILSIDSDNHRISLSIKDVSQEGMLPPVEGGLAEGSVVDAIVDKTENFGIFLRLPGNQRGLLPNKEIDLPANSDLSKAYPLESTIKVMVQRIDSNGRIRLSQKALSQKQEEIEYREYSNKQVKREEKSESFGTLGDLLKNIKRK